MMTKGSLINAVVNAVAGTVVLAAGGTIIGLKVHDATQDQQIVQLQNLDENVSKLSDQLDETNQHLAHLEGQYEPRH
jgi:hypothetical protein